MSYLSRYLSFPKLMDMIYEDDEGNPKLKIPFTCMEIQNDPIEGVFNYDDLRASIETFKNYKNYVLEDGGEIINESKTLLLVANTNGVDSESVRKVLDIRKSSYLSCWVEGGEESLPMWNMYSGRQGFLITVRKDELIKQLNSKVNKADEVEYEKKNSEPEEVPFLKNEYYKYENEFRFLIKEKSCSDKVIFREIERGPDLDLKIKSHPQMEDWIEKSYKEIIKNAGLSCIKSDFYDDFHTVKRILEDFS